MSYDFSYVNQYFSNSFYFVYGSSANLRSNLIAVNQNRLGFLSLALPEDEVPSSCFLKE